MAKDRYVLLDEEEAVFIDPGSIPDFPVIMRKVIEVVRPAEISLIVASHQDPDVCGNLPVVEDVIDRPDLRVAAHMNTVRLSEEWSLFAKGDFLTPMAAFHRLYMPTRELLARCMDQVAELPVQRICPQHGSILQGSQVKEAITFLKTLPCAMDAT